MNLKNLSPGQADLVKALSDVGLTEEEIGQFYSTTEENTQTIKEEDPVIEKSIDDQIAAKQAEIDKLNELKTLEKADGNTLFNSPVDTDEIVKSVTAEVNKSNEKIGSDISALTSIVKGLSNVVVELKTSNEQLVKDNDDLKKSFTDNGDILSKIAQQTPGLRSASRHTTPINRFQTFEKSEEGKEVISIAESKSEISSRLASEMDNPEFMKSLGQDIENFECSGTVSPKLEKAFSDVLNIQVVQ